MPTTKRTPELESKALELRQLGHTWKDIANELGLGVITLRRWFPNRERDYKGERSKNPQFGGLTRREYVETDHGKVWLALVGNRKHSKKYGWASCEASVDEILEQWTGACKLCKKQISLENRDRALDHCHETGKFRGWLCQKCNVGLGCFDDNPEKLKRAIQYLEEG